MEEVLCLVCLEVVSEDAEPVWCSLSLSGAAQGHGGHLQCFSQLAPSRCPGCRAELSLPGSLFSWAEGRKVATELPYKKPPQQHHATQDEQAARALAAELGSQELQEVFEIEPEVIQEQVLSDDGTQTEISDEEGLALPASVLQHGYW